MIYIARESSTGKLYLLNVKNRDPEAPYHQFAKDVLGEDQEDVGNIDVDLFRVPGGKKRRTVEIKLPG